MKFKINNKQWIIKEVGEEEFCKVGIEFKDAYGLCTAMNKTIYIKKNHPDISLKETIIHELVHAHLDSFGLKGNFEPMAEENLCEFIAMNSENILEIANKYLKER